MPDPTQTKPGDPDTTPEEGREEVTQAARSEEQAKRLSDEQKAKATAWFLSDPPPTAATQSFQLNVSTEHGKPEWIPWTVKALPRERITEIRENAAQTGDEASANLRIATEGTIVPSLLSDELRGRYADPADALKARFAFKSGLIDQIAGKVIQTTGYDADDVKELEAVKT